MYVSFEQSDLLFQKPEFIIQKPEFILNYKISINFISQSLRKIQRHLVQNSMDEQVQSIKRSLDKISIQEFRSKNGNSTKHKGSNISFINTSIKSLMSLQYENNPDLLKQLSGSDSKKISEQLSNSMKSQSLSKGRQNILVDSNQISQDKGNFRELNPHVQDESQGLFRTREITHQCQCMLFNKSQYCPQFCDCYQKPQQCSQIQCCPQCYACKAQRLPQLLKKCTNLGITQKKSSCSGPQNLNKKSKNHQSCEIGQYIVGIKRPTKQFRKQRCQCRNSKCQNKYCVCFTAGNKCTINCMCQNCINCELVVGIQANRNQAKVKVQSMNIQISSGQFPSQMGFQPVQFQFLPES